MVFLPFQFKKMLMLKGKHLNMKVSTFFHMQQMKKAVTMYGPRSPFPREIVNAMVSSIGTFIPYDWKILTKALLKPGEYLQWTMWFQDIARGHANRNA